MHKVVAALLPWLAAAAAALPAPALAARPAVSAVGDQSVVEGGALVVPVTATDADGDTVTFSGVRLPGFCAVVADGINTANLECHPGPGDDGVYPKLSVAAADPGGVVGRSPGFTVEVVDAGVASLRMTVILEQETYDLTAPADPVRIKVRVENTGPDNLWLRDGLSAAALQYYLVFHDPQGHQVVARDLRRAAAGQVQDRLGEPVPPRMYFDPLGNPLPVEEVEEVGGTLDGGFAYEVTLPDAHAYIDLNQPGPWTVEVRYPTRSYAKASVDSVKALQVNKKRDFARIVDGNPAVLRSPPVRFSLTGTSNHPPVADAGPDQVVEATSPAGAPVVLDGSGSSDPDNDTPLTYAWTGPFGVASGVSPTVVVGLGEGQAVTLEVSDPSDASDADGMLVSVRDTTPPVVTPPEDVRVEALGSPTTVDAATLGTATAFDLVDGALTVMNDAPAGFPADPGAWVPAAGGGMDNPTTVLWWAVDSVALQGSATQVVTVHNTPPLALPGITEDQAACIQLSCWVTLSGSDSSDVNSTPGTQDDIDAYHWYEDFGTPGVVSLGDGETLDVSLPLGPHEITLVVTDRVGNQSVPAGSTAHVDPALLSLFEVRKAEVAWKKDRIKMDGVVALPVAKALADVAPTGSVSVRLGDLGEVVAQAVTFDVRGDQGRHWEYKGGPASPVSAFKINWKGSRFEYRGDLRLRSRHLGADETNLEVKAEGVQGAYSITVGGVTIDVAADGTMTASDPDVRFDVDEDGEIEIVLPFALTPDMTFELGGALSGTIAVADYYTAAVGKFELTATAPLQGIDPDTLPATMEVEVHLGAEGFPGTDTVDVGEWKSHTSKEWKHERD